MGLENVFLSVLPIVIAGTIDIWSSATFFSNSRSVRRARPLGGLEQARAISWLPSRRQKSAQPPVSPVACGSTPPRSLLPPVACAPGKPWKRWCPSLDNPAVTPACTGFQTSAFNNIRAFSSRWAGLLPFRINASSRSRSSSLSCTTYFFTEISLAAIIISVARVATNQITKRPSLQLIEAAHDQARRSQRNLSWDFFVRVEVARPSRFGAPGSRGPENAFSAW